MAPIPYMNLLISVCMVQNNVDSSHNSCFLLCLSCMVCSDSFNVLRHQTPIPPSVSAIERGVYWETPHEPLGA